MTVHEDARRLVLALPEDAYQARRGQFAVVVDGRIDTFFPSFDAAYRHVAAYPPVGTHSVQEVRRAPHLVGFTESS